MITHTCRISVDGRKYRRRVCFRMCVEFNLRQNMHSMVFECFSADIRRRIKKIVWTRIDAFSLSTKTHPFENALLWRGPNAFPKVCVLLSSKTHRSIRVHTTAVMRFRLSALKPSKTLELHV